MNMPLLSRVVVIVSALLLSSCSMFGDGVTDLTLKITVAGDANPDESGRASPVFLRIIELRDTSTFKYADYLRLYQDPRSELGATFIHSTEIGPLFPNSTRTEEVRLNQVTAAVGLLGEFNRYDDMQTSQWTELKPGKDKTIKLLIDGRGIHLN